MERVARNRVANRDARWYVTHLRPFTGSNIDAVWRKNNLTGDRMYVVTSYGAHFPLFIWENGVWYENVDKYSVTTSKHRSQTHPHCETIPMTCKDMVCLQYYGIGGVAAGMECVA
jgi:hypothetical protein